MVSEVFRHALAIIIPAYNEEIPMAKVIEDFHRIRPDAYIVVVDNASKDKTASIAQETLQRLGASGRVLSYNLQGKGFAVRHAFREIDAEIYVMVDGDDTYSAADLPILLDPVQAGDYDMVTGDRLHVYRNTSARKFHYLGNLGVSTIINVFFRSQIHDIFSGYRVFHRKFIKNFPILSRGFELETEITLHALSNHYRICEIPIAYQDRQAGSVSKLNTFSDGFKIIRLVFSLFRLYYPLRFFSWIGVSCIAVGLFLGVPVVTHFLGTGLVPRVPTAILVAILEIVGILCVGLGLILDTVIKLNQRQAELWRLNHSMSPPFGSRRR